MSHPDLASLQLAIAELIRESAPLAGDAARAPLVARIATGNERLSPAEQLDVYREQYLLRHVDVLREDFLSLEHALGDAEFEGLATAYLQAFPSRSFSLRDLGERLPRFVAERAPWSADPLLADLARVEWAFVEAFDAPDAPPLALADVAAIAEEAWPSVRLALQPSVQRLALRYPAHEARLVARSTAQTEGQRAAPFVRPAPAAEMPASGWPRRRARPVARSKRRSARGSSGGPRSAGSVASTWRRRPRPCRTSWGES